MTIDPGPLAIMGGAFDPVHSGHLRTAVEVHEALLEGELRLIPSAVPPHREAHHAPGSLRVRMLEAAAAELEWCSVDDRELRREGPSFTVLTLEELRAEWPQRSLCMILGMDAFLGLPEWHRSAELLDLAHIVVAHRPGWLPPTDGALGELLARRQVGAATELSKSPAGHIYVLPVTQLEISSSAIRAIIAAGRDPRYLLPEGVLDVIHASGCYRGQARNQPASTTN
jgi:nicotinate-nucleotide adenylyltransferase